MKNNLIRSIFIITLLLSMFGGCGGGSVGTGYNPGSGSGQEYRGTITASGNPLANANVTVVETGETATTDSSGQFTVSIPTGLETFHVEVKYQGKTSNVEVDQSKQSVINVEIDVTTPSKPITVETFAMTAKIVGLCDAYFENKRVIRQSNKTPQGIECTVKVETEGDGLPLGGVRFAIEHRGCSSSSPWILDAASETSQQYFPGIGQLQFKFFDSSKYCEYHVVAPYGGNYKSPIEYRIETFTRQAK